jgi:NTE family protein
VAESETMARDLYVAGATKLGGYMVDPFAPAREGGTPRQGVLDQIVLMMGSRRPGKLGLCLAGGGIEGLIYELGVVLALDDFLVGRKILDFDVFCGISAGAFIAALLANGLTPRDVVDGMREGSRFMEPMGRKVLFRPNLSELARRVWSLARGALRTRGDAGERPQRFDLLSSLLRVVPGGFFSGEPIKWYLEDALTRPGRTNSFRQLRKELYIGATDQDSGRPLVFGEAGLRDVPISHAVRASAALVPFYPPEQVNGRHIVDGAFTRTTNFPVAIRHGARLVVIVNPFVPAMAARSGSVHRQGGVFAGLQGIKSLVHSRFDQVYSHIEDNYPDADFELFLPEGEELEQLAGTLMKFFYRVEIVELAYEHTAAKIRRRLPSINETFRRHGLLLRDPESTTPVRLSGPEPRSEARVPDIVAGASG